jgi:hypothetical protein
MHKSLESEKCRVPHHEFGKYAYVHGCVGVHIHRGGTQHVVNGFISTSSQLSSTTFDPAPCKQSTHMRLLTNWSSETIQGGGLSLLTHSLSHIYIYIYIYIYVYTHYCTVHYWLLCPIHALHSSPTTHRSKCLPPITSCVAALRKNPKGRVFGRGVVLMFPTYTALIRHLRHSHIVHAMPTKLFCHLGTRWQLDPATRLRLPRIQVY